MHKSIFSAIGIFYHISGVVEAGTLLRKVRALKKLNFQFSKLENDSTEDLSILKIIHSGVDSLNRFHRKLCRIDISRNHINDNFAYLELN